MFKNRTEAGRLLAEALAKYKNKKTVVFAVPRGGVVIGYEVARALGAPLDIVVPRKIGHPENPEYAICAVDDQGLLLCNEKESDLVDQVWLEKEILRQKEEAGRRSALYRAGREPEAVSGKIVILADDGIATGFTMRLAIRSLKKQKPEKIIVAVPVAASDAVFALYEEGADEVLTILKPQEFLGAIGVHYELFEQVEDNEVIKLMQKSRE